MTTYYGQRTDRGACVFRQRDGKAPRRFRAFVSQMVRYHSPDGFEWGYGGSGPAQLALALLIDVIGDPDEAEELYQRFKFDVVAALDRDHWRLTSAEILGWVHRELERRWEAEVRAVAGDVGPGVEWANPQQSERDNLDRRN